MYDFGMLVLYMFTMKATKGFSKAFHEAKYTKKEIQNERLPELEKQIKLVKSKQRR